MSMHWERSEGDDAVIYGYQDPYTARIVEGRVTRWQVGDEREPTRLAGRTTRGMNEAQEACALAVQLLELSDAGADVQGLPSGEAVTWAMVDDLRDQIGERDGVIAQLRATLKRYTDVYGDPADSARLTAEYAASFASGLREEMARIEREAPQIKAGDRVMWCDKTLTGVVVDQWMGEVAGEMQCRVRSDDGREWQATINELEVVK